jgi:hypothetical protein
VRQIIGEEPRTAAADPPSERGVAQRWRPIQRADGPAELVSYNAEEARHVRRAKRHALWLMAGSGLVTVTVVAGIWMLLR